MTSKNIAKLSPEKEMPLLGGSSPFIAGGEWTVLGVGSDVYTDKTKTDHPYNGLLLENTATQAVFSFSSLSKEVVDKDGKFISALEIGQNKQVFELAKSSKTVGDTEKGLRQLFSNNKVMVVEKKVAVSAEGQRPYVIRLVGLEKVTDQ